MGENGAPRSGSRRDIDGSTQRERHRLGGFAVGAGSGTRSGARLAFLADQTGIASFIVPSDFDRHVVRSYVYVYLAEIEQLLAELVKAAMTGEQIIMRFQPRNNGLYRSVKQKGREAHPVEYLFLSDYERLIPQVAVLQAHQTWEPLRQAEDLAQLVELRNGVTHASKSLVGALEPLEIARRAGLASAVLGSLRLVQP